MARRKIAFCLLSSFARSLLSLAGAASALGAEEMPRDFVYLRAIDPTIQQDIRYAGPNNFTGKPVPGYDAAGCVLVRQAAEALKAVQADLRAKGLALKVYDCYRPARAVRSFVAWAKLPDDPEAKRVYYPNLDKTALFPDYIATQSGHSRGATVDLTLVLRGEPTQGSPGSGPCTAPQGSQASDGSLVMGTTFDCFDGKSAMFASSITAEQHRNRTLLANVMRKHSFKEYGMEWWHFTLANEPYPETYFDFPILPRAAAGKE
jgi:D-alanyl-D-alanine dipeptidase